MLKPFIIELGPVRLTIAVGDADHNGALDVVLGVRLKGLFEWTFPPVNLDAKLAAEVAETFEAIGKKITGKK